jgi:hypothetical protein
VFQRVERRLFADELGQEDGGSAYGFHGVSLSENGGRPAP